MSSEKIKQGLKKIKFYDSCFKIWIASIFISFIILAIYAFAEIESILYIFVIIFITDLIAGACITIGMIYHAFNGKMWIWLIVILASFFFWYSTPIVITLYYVFVMRDNFKEGIYN